MKRIIAAVLCALQLLMLCACSSEKKPAQTAGVKDSQNGVQPEYLPDTVCFTSKNYTVTAAMFSYLFYSVFYDDVAANGVYYSYLGFDPAKPLRSQVYSESEKSSWFDYYVSITASSLNSYLCYAEEAIEKGYEKKDFSVSADAQIAAFAAEAQAEGMEMDRYYEFMFGRGVDEACVRAVLDLIMYSRDYHDYLYAGFADGVSEADCEDYYLNNTKELSCIDYLCYTVTAGNGNELYQAVLGGDEEGFRSSILSGDADATVNEITNAYYSKDDSFSEWAFDAQRVPGDVYFDEDAEGNGNLYFLKKTPAKDERKTKNACHILLTGNTYGDNEAIRKKAEEVLGEWQAGAKTKESFEEIAYIYSEDVKCSYSNIMPGETATEFDSWVYDEYREYGDADIITTKNGTHVIFFAGDGAAVWSEAAKTAIIEEKLNEASKDIFTRIGAELDEKNEILKLTPDNVGANVYAALSSQISEQ